MAELSRISQLPEDLHYLLLMEEDPMYLQILLEKCPDLQKVGTSCIFQRDYAIYWREKTAQVTAENFARWAILRQIDLVYAHKSLLVEGIDLLMRNSYQGHLVENSRALWWLGQYFSSEISELIFTFEDPIQKMYWLTTLLKDMKQNPDLLARSCYQHQFPLGLKLIFSLYPDQDYTFYLIYLIAQKTHSADRQFQKEVKRGRVFNRSLVQSQSLNLGNHGITTFLRRAQPPGS